MWIKFDSFHHYYLKDKFMFCILKKDEKTYHYFKQFVQYIRDNRIDCLTELDIYIQKGEILNHCNDKNDIVGWLQNHACEVRFYINTIKIAAVLWSLMNKMRIPNWDDYINILELLNSKKEYLESIHA